MFNFSGSEVIFLMILGLVILGPEKLPGVLRKAGRLYGEFKRVTSDAQSELRQALDQPIKEIQSTARTYQNFFVEAAKETTKDPVPPTNTASSSGSSTPQGSDAEPTFVPYESPPPAVEDQSPSSPTVNGDAEASGSGAAVESDGTTST